MRFRDRRHAGQLLAKKLQHYGNHAVVYALPRGGVEVAVEVAKALQAPLELVVSRKIGHPANPEYAVCAVTETGPLICDEAERGGLEDAWLVQAEANERAEAKRRREVYQADHPLTEVRGKTAIVIDDGIATGLTMRAAIEMLRKLQPAKIVIAVPVAPEDVVQELKTLADQVIVLADLSTFFGAIGAHYNYFPQLQDREVIALLKEAEQ